MRQELAEREITKEGPRNKKGVRRQSSSVTVNVAESPLSWLHAHGHLDGRLFDAGERLRADYERAQLSASLTMSWDPVRIKGSAGSGLSPTERQAAARQHFLSAIDHAGKGLDDILWRVICAGDSLATAEKSLKWPARSGKLVLKLALDRIADFYRIT